MKRVFITLSIFLFFILFDFFYYYKVFGNVDNPQKIEEGIYEVYYSDTTKVIDIEASSQKNNANVEIYERGNQSNQKFKLKLNSDGTYTFFAMHSYNKVLDVTAEGNVCQYELHGGNNQKWYIESCGEGYYNIISKSSGLYLDVEYGMGLNCQNVQVYDGHRGKSQKFALKKIKAEVGTQTAEDGTYRILSKVNNKKAFNIETGYSENDVKLEVLENTKNSLQQKFEIKYDGKGYYRIKSKQSNKVLTLESETPKIGSKIEQQEDKDLDTQKWILKKYSESIYSIVSKCGNLYITLEDCNIQDGQDLRLMSENGLKTQQFILVNETPEKNIMKIEDGIYQIVTKGNKVVDVEGGSYSNIANVLIWNNTEVQQQKYQITKLEDANYYKITAIHSGKTLDVEGGATNPGANIIQYDYLGTSNQEWLLKDCGDGYCNIISKSNGLCLDVTAGQIKTAGANVELWYSNGADAQKFKLMPINIINNGTYEIETKLDSNKVVDIEAASQEDEGNALIWSAGNVDHERFFFEAFSGDTYKIIAKHSNKALTVDLDTNNVYQNTDIEAENQQWQIKVAGNGYYNLISKANGKALQVYNGLAQNGQNIQVNDFHNGKEQQFRFITGFRKFNEEGNYGKSGLAEAGDERGSNLKYYKYGKGSKVFFATFSIHGFEDSYNHDGSELTYIAEEFKKYIDNNMDESIINNWTIYIFPNLNPDGQKHGWTNNGPGRNTLYSQAPENKGIDMNRSWSIGYKSESSERNYNGTAAFQAYEARYLRDFLLSHQGSKNILIDTHGWLNETIGDNELGSYYRNQFGLSSHINSYGAGYLINWARTLRNARSVLLELPEVKNHNQIVERNYAQKYINATIQLLREK